MLCPASETSDASADMPAARANSYGAGGNSAAPRPRSTLLIAITVGSTSVLSGAADGSTRSI
jgi:hypothetical protein